VSCVLVAVAVQTCSALNTRRQGTCSFASSHDHRLGDFLYILLEADAYRCMGCYTRTHRSLAQYHRRFVYRELD
jgi:hypothetical protein